MVRKNANGEFVLKDFTAAEKLSAAINVYEKYVNILSERSLFDYDDMILSVIQACESHPELRANLQEQFQFIMVDEFQDTNLAQLRLLFNLTSENDDNPNIMAVGDDDQAIFSFQGADVGNIQRFRQHYHDPKNHRFDRQLSFRREYFIVSAGRYYSRRGSTRKHD